MSNILMIDMFPSYRVFVLRKSVKQLRYEHFCDLSRDISLWLVSS